MQNYLVVVDAVGRDALSQAGVDFSVFDYNGHAGVLITESELTGVLAALHSEIDEEFRTDQDLLKILKLRAERNGEATGSEGDLPTEEPRTNVTVRHVGWNKPGPNPYGNAVKSVLLATLPEGAVSEIVIENKQGKPMAPVEDGRFHIHLWSSPKGEAVCDVPDKIWGIKVPSRKKALSSTGAGVPILDGELFDVAEFVGDRNLYIHHNIMSEGTGDESKLFRRILEEVALLLPLSKEQREKHRVERLQIPRDASKRLYITRCTVDLNGKVKELEKGVEGSRKKLAEAQEALTKQIRTVALAEEELSQLQAKERTQDELLAREFEKLLATPMVRDIIVHEGRVEVITEMIYVKDPRTQKIHEIGRFRVVFDPNAKSDEDVIRFYNLTRFGTRPGDGGGVRMMHPHVNETGWPCLGTHKELLRQAIRRFEFTEATILSIKFLEQVNVVNDIWGQAINRWPLKEGQ